jgi:hypothetical protein
MCIHKNDVGARLIYTITDEDGIVNLSTYDDITLTIRKADGTTMQKTMALYTDGTDGRAIYVSETGDFDVEGVYKLQISITEGVTIYKTSSMFNLVVKDNL